MHGRGWAAYAAEHTFHWLVDSLALSGCGWAAAAAMSKRKDLVFRPGHMLSIIWVPVFFGPFFKVRCLPIRYTEWVPVTYGQVY